MTSPQDPFAAPGDQPQQGQQPPPDQPAPPPGYGTPPPGYGTPPGYGAPPPGYGPPPPGYGTPPPGYPAYPPAYGQPAYGQGQKTNTLAIVGFILSLPIVCPLIGTVLCFIALSQIKRTGEGGKGLAIAGICVSLGLVVLGLGLLAVGTVVGSSSSGY